MLAATSVILVVIGNLSVIHIQNPGISDSHTIGIAPDVLKNLVDSLGRGLRIDDPIFSKAGATTLCLPRNSPP